MDIDYFTGISYPPMQESLTSANDTAPGAAKTADGKPRSMITGRLKINELLELTKEAGKWHVNMRDAIAAMVAEGWTNEQIKIACGPYCDNGPHDPDIVPLIDTARNKWNIPEPDLAPAPVALKDKTEKIESIKQEFNINDWRLVENYQGEPEPINWLVENIFPQQTPILLAAQGGLGKSFLALQLALEVAKPDKGEAMNTKRAFGGRVIGHGHSVFITAEDSYNSLHRRLEGLDPNNLRKTYGGNISVIPMAEIGGPMPIVTGGHVPELTAFFEVLKEQLLKIDNLKLVIVDPLQAFVAADITANPEVGQFVWSALSNIAYETGASVLVTHHMRKDGMNKIKGPADAREAIRGSTALVDGARLAYALWPVSNELGRAIATKLDMEYEENRVVQGAVCKSNDQADFAVTTYWREDTGVLRDVGHLDIGELDYDSGLTTDQAKQALREIDMAFNDGKPFSPSPRSDRYLINWLMKTFSISRAAAKRQMDNWTNPPGFDAESLIEQVTFTDKDRNKRAAYKVKKIP
jgi:RecA-family ATPase